MRFFEKRGGLPGIYFLADDPAKNTTPGGASDNGDSGKGDATTKPKTIEEYEAENARLKKVVGDQGNELGTLRRFQEAVANDPVETSKKLLEGTGFQILDPNANNPASVFDILNGNQGNQDPLANANQNGQTPQNTQTTPGIDPAEFARAVDQAVEQKIARLTSDLERKLDRRIAPTEHKVYGAEFDKMFPDKEFLDPYATEIKAKVATGQMTDPELYFNAARGTQIGPILEEAEVKIREKVMKEFGIRMQDSNVAGRRGEQTQTVGNEEAVKDVINTLSKLN